jgi:hypothetical protein
MNDGQRAAADGWERHPVCNDWRRRLPDGSYLFVTYDPQWRPPTSPMGGWTWRHRGPDYDRRILGTHIHAEGHAASSVAAKAAADAHAAALTHLTTQSTLFGGAP